VSGTTLGFGGQSGFGDTTAIPGMPGNALAASAPTQSNPLGGVPPTGSGGWPAWMTTAWGMPASQQSPQAQPTASQAQPAAAQQLAALPSPNAAAQSTLDDYAKVLTGTGYGQLGNGPIDPGTMFFLNAVNPQLAQSMWGTPQFPLSGGWGVAAGGGAAGGSGGTG
jgi:hypothetical protein